MGFAVAVGFMAIAAVPLGILAIVEAVQALRGRPLEMPSSALGTTVLVVWGSYLVAGQGAALAFYLLRPLRRWFLGWIATGFLIAVIAYGVIGIALALFFDPVGRLFLEHSTAEEAWKLVHFTPWLGLVGVAAGAWQWWEAHPQGTRDRAI